MKDYVLIYVFLAIKLMIFETIIYIVSWLLLTNIGWTVMFMKAFLFGAATAIPMIIFSHIIRNSKFKFSFVLISFIFLVSSIFGSFAGSQILMRIFDLKIIYQNDQGLLIYFLTAVVLSFIIPLIYSGLEKNCHKDDSIDPPGNV